VSVSASDQFAAIDDMLLLLSEVRERAESAARMIANGDGQAHLAEALQRMDRDLHALHRRLMDETLFHAPAYDEPDAQLALDAA
jgi:hypothetical protein